MDKINKVDVERYRVTLIDNTYPETAYRVLFTGLDKAVARSIARHYNKVNPCYASWCEWTLAGIDYDRAMHYLKACGWTQKGAEKYLEGCSLENWDVNDLEWACLYIVAR